MAGLRTSPADGGDHSFKKRVQANLRGILRARAPKDTQKELTIIGRMAKDPWLGTHLSPRMKVRGTTFKMRGSPCSKIKKVISARIRTEDNASKRRIVSMIFSFILQMS